MNNGKQTAAFIRAEAIIVSKGVVAASAYLAVNRPGVRERVFRLGQAMLAAPLHGLLGQNDRTLGNRVAHLALRDMTVDRITVLAQEYVEDILRDEVFDGGVDLIKRARDEGHRVVLISEGIAQVMETLAGHVRGIDELVCNHLEVRNGRATGKLLDPIIGGHEGGRWVRDYAEKNDVDLARSVAFAAHAPDLLLLAAVGRPCAVNPDYTLRKAAEEADWPIIEYSS
jgi:phosphoserine phosphatase